MGRRQEVTDAIERILKDEIPEIPWTVLVKGFKRSKQTEGTISCDEVSFSDEAKGERTARAIYSICAISGAADDVNIDFIADKLDEVILNNPTLDDWATTAKITQILFGVAQGGVEAGAFIATLDVTYDSNKE